MKQKELSKKEGTTVVKKPRRAIEAALEQKRLYMIYRMVGMITLI